MNLTLEVWRQKNKDDKGGFETYKVSDISSEMSFLEMFDVLNEQLVKEGKEPIAFDHDCREGICGACSMYIDGKPHGPWAATTTCQLHIYPRANHGFHNDTTPRYDKAAATLAWQRTIDFFREKLA